MAPLHQETDWKRKVIAPAWAQDTTSREGKQSLVRRNSSISLVGVKRPLHPESFLGRCFLDPSLWEIFLLPFSLEPQLMLTWGTKPSPRTMQISQLMFYLEKAGSQQFLLIFQKHRTLAFLHLIPVILVCQNHTHTQNSFFFFLLIIIIILCGNGSHICWKATSMAPRAFLPWAI